MKLSSRTLVALTILNFLNILPSSLVAEEPRSSPISFETECKGRTYNNSAVDYRAPDHQKYIRGIERNHFNENVRSGIKGQTGSLMGDLDFILRNIPNHYPGLNVVADLDIGQRSDPNFPSTDCYFLRALRFAPDDGMVSLAYGVALARLGRGREAGTQYQIAIQRLSEPAEAHYNLALLYLASNDIEHATQHATIAYERGYPLPGLRNRLAKRNVHLD